MLAIVIPAYKVKYLKETLQSLSNQTDKNFNVYIGDDDSKDEIEKCVNKFNDKLNIFYHKFPRNLGGKSLTAQWQRCIDLINKEEWLWLLPDDDIISPDCVNVFYEAIGLEKYDTFLFRFQTNHIDEYGNQIKAKSDIPQNETNVDFAISKLNFERCSSVAEYIYSKKEFNICGGFTHLPLAWGSDDLLWIKLAQEKDIITLPNGLVSLRQTDLNISSNITTLARMKFDAKYKYLSMLIADKVFMDKLLRKYSFKEFRDIITKHIFYEFKSFDIQFSKKDVLKYARLNNSVIGGGFFKNVYRILRYQYVSK